MPDETVTMPPPEKQLGGKPARSDPRTLNFARFVQLDKVPTTHDPWKRRTPFLPRKFGNDVLGDCTRASQALFATRLERVETRRTPQILDAEVERVYFDMTWREYGDGKSGAAMPPEWSTPGGPGDVGAYELDALNAWRRPEQTFRDADGHPVTVEAFAKVNHADLEEVRAAMAVSGKYGVKICFALPRIWRGVDPPAVWDVPRDANGKALPLIGDAEGGSWGYHSMYMCAYHGKKATDKPRLVCSWYEGFGAIGEQDITWEAVAAYATESYWVIDSVDEWRKRTPTKLAEAVDLSGIVKAVNRTSSHKIKA